MTDVLLIGGGVVGLSLAYELAGSGASVRLIDRGTPGQEASWAGAGILPPAVNRPGDHPLERLTGLSHSLHPMWAQRLREETGIDNGFLPSGGLYVARQDSLAGALHEAARQWQQRGIEAQELTSGDLKRLEPVLAGDSLRSVWLLPGEAQIRNPRHLKALIAACAQRGVEISAGLAAEDFEIRGGRVQGVRTVAGTLSAASYCLTSGAWTRALSIRLGCELPLKPVRGQMVLLNCGRRIMRRIVNEGPRYLVPRVDGRLLVGSTEEDAGYDTRTSAAGIEGLLAFALSLAPELGQAQLERSWAGLRPGTADGLPYLGRVPGLDNAFVAAGHFRQGLHLSCGTALVMRQLILGQTPEIELAAFGLQRDRPAGSND